MRLVLVVYALALCCCSFSRAYGTVPVAEQESGPEIAATSTGSATAFLKGSKDMKAESEDEERALNLDQTAKLEAVSEKLPFATKLKQFVNRHFQFGDGKSVANAAKAVPDDAKGTLDQAKTGTDQAKAMTDDAKGTLDQAKTGTDQAKAVTDDAKGTLDQAKIGTDQAKTGTDQAKAVTAEAPKEFTKLDAWKIIMKGQVKPLTIIAAIALSGGYVVYLVKG